MLLLLNKQNLSWLYERFVDLGWSMHSSTQMNLSRAQTNQARMPGISVFFGEAKLKSLEPRVHSVTKLQKLVESITSYLEGTVVESVNPDSSPPLTASE